MTLAVKAAALAHRSQLPYPLSPMLGLFASFYVLMRFATGLVLDHSLRLIAIYEDIFERIFITAGFAALLLLIAMAATSPIAIRRRRRGRHCTTASHIVGVVHFC